MQIIRYVTSLLLQSKLSTVVNDKSHRLNEIIAQNLLEYIKINEVADIVG